MTCDLSWPRGLRTKFASATTEYDSGRVALCSIIQGCACNRHYEPRRVAEFQVAGATDGVLRINVAGATTVCVCTSPCGRRSMVRVQSDTHADVSRDKIDRVVDSFGGSVS